MADKRLNIAIFTPYLQGFYYGELINQMRQLCIIKRYSLTLVATSSLGEYNSQYLLSSFDAVIILRNAISLELAEKLHSRAVPCVSIAYDYFPLSIPVVTSDNYAGMTLAFNHLFDAGHRQIAFVGDLSQYDLRKRFKAYCELLEQHDLPVDDNLRFEAANTLFSGGQKAATEFIARDCQATGVICGAGLTGIGFYTRLREVSHTLAKSVQIVSFDAIPLIPSTAPEICSVDQNLHLIAYSCFNLLEQMLRGESVKHNLNVESRLIVPDKTASRETTNIDYLTTCVESRILNNPCYTKSIINNMYEWPLEIANSNLNEIMSLTPLFKDFMEKCFLSRIHLGSDGIEYTKLVKIFLRQHFVAVPKNDPDSLCQAEFAPPKTAREENIESYQLNTNFPIFINNKLWGFFSVYGDNVVENPDLSYMAFLGFLELTLHFWANKLAGALEPKAAVEQAKVRGLSSSSCVVCWDFESGVIDWNDDALTLLGLTSDLERNIYKNMELADRLHPDDEAYLREQCILCQQAVKPFVTEVRLKAKGKQFGLFRLEGHPIVNDKQKVTKLEFYLHASDASV